MAALAALGLLGLASTVSAGSYNGYREFKFKNKCPYDVYIAMNGGSCANAHSPIGGDVSCGSDGDCRPNSECIQTGQTRQCFFKPGVPLTGSTPEDYRLTPGEETIVRIPVLTDKSAIWSGVIGGRTDCNPATGLCGGCECNIKNDDPSVWKWPGCPMSKGLLPPCAQAEMTLQSDAQDYYDVTLINGWNQAIMMAPTDPFGNDLNYANVKTLRPLYPYQEEAYWCGNPGAVSNAIGPYQPVSTWQFQPPSIEYRWVTRTGTVCSSDSQCSNGMVCGTAWTNTYPFFFVMNCGYFKGYWTGAQICPLQSTYKPTVFKCSSLIDLYMCAGSRPDSCYQNGAQSSCCGCADWWTLNGPATGLPIPVPQNYTGLCKNKNTEWVSNVQPTLLWIKEGCPSCYTYPYDDFSSTFQCASNPFGQGVNLQGYSITYCPDGVKQSDYGKIYTTSTPLDKVVPCTPQTWSYSVSTSPAQTATITVQLIDDVSVRLTVASSTLKFDWGIFYMMKSPTDQMVDACVYNVDGRPTNGPKNVASISCDALRPFASDGSMPSTVYISAKVKLSNYDGTERLIPGPGANVFQSVPMVCNPGTPAPTTVPPTTIKPTTPTTESPTTWPADQTTPAPTTPWPTTTPAPTTQAPTTEQTTAAPTTPVTTSVSISLQSGYSATFSVSSCPAQGSTSKVTVTVTPTTGLNRIEMFFEAVGGSQCYSSTNSCQSSTGLTPDQLKALRVRLAVQASSGNFDFPSGSTWSSANLCNVPTPTTPTPTTLAPTVTQAATTKTPTTLGSSSQRFQLTSSNGFYVTPIGCPGTITQLNLALTGQSPFLRVTFMYSTTGVGVGTEACVATSGTGDLTLACTFNAPSGASTLYFYIIADFAGAGASMIIGGTSSPLAGSRIYLPDMSGTSYNYQPVAISCTTTDITTTSLPTGTMNAYSQSFQFASGFTLTTQVTGGCSASALQLSIATVSGNANLYNAFFYIATTNAGTGLRLACSQPNLGAKSTLTCSMDLSAWTSWTSGNNYYIYLLLDTVQGSRYQLPPPNNGIQYQQVALQCTAVTATTATPTEAGATTSVTGAGYTLTTADSAKTYSVVYSGSASLMTMTVTASAGTMKTIQVFGNYRNDNLRNNFCEYTSASQVSTISCTWVPAPPAGTTLSDSTTVYWYVQIDQSYRVPPDVNGGFKSTLISALGGVITSAPSGTTAAPGNGEVSMGTNILGKVTCGTSNSVRVEVTGSGLPSFSGSVSIYGAATQQGTYGQLASNCPSITGGYRCTFNLPLSGSLYFYIFGNAPSLGGNVQVPSSGASVATSLVCGAGSVLAASLDSDSSVQAVSIAIGVVVAVIIGVVVVVRVAMYMKKKKNTEETAAEADPENNVEMHQAERVRVGSTITA